MMEALDIEAGNGPGAYRRYMEYSSAPLTGFLFALPLFLVYHAGLWWLNTFSGLRWANAVDISIANGLNRLGMAGPLLSFIAVVLVFLTMHAMTGKPWSRPPFYTWFLMVLESLALSLPVFLLSRLVVKLVDYLPIDSMLLPVGALWESGRGTLLSAGMLSAEGGVAAGGIGGGAHVGWSCGEGVGGVFG